jgi:LPS-assembly protein
MLELPLAMRVRLFLCITLLLLCHPQLWPQAVTMQFPQAEQQHPAAAAASPQAADSSAPPASALPDAPDLDSTLPEAHVVPMPPKGTPVKLIADTQTRSSAEHANIYTLDGHVVIYYRNYIVHADHATYNDNSSEIVAYGHMIVDGGADDEHFESTHGTINVQDDTGHFYDVQGTLGVREVRKGKAVFTSPNPYAITGKEVFQLGKGKYRVFHGTMTSCRLPDPDWRVFSNNILLGDSKATTSNAVFQMLHVPIFYLPYLTHPVGENMRESGILLPYFGNNTTKGLLLGEGFYLTLGRSADLTVESQYFSKRGFAPAGMFRYKGLGENFANIHFHSLLDRGFQSSPGVFVNQGGIDIVGDGRYDFDPDTRAVIDAEYLSSYIYRLTFEENYAIAINSEVKSQAFVTHADHDIWTSVRTNRYQSFQGSAVPGDEIRIIHLPEIDVDAADRQIGVSPFVWGVSGSAAALSRYEYPSFRTTAEVPRTDIYPRLSMPLHFDGWSVRPEAAVRETWYGKSQYPVSLDQFPTIRSAGTSRTDIETGVEFRPPALERDFSAPWLRHLLGGDLRHAIEPDIQYRYVTGINNFRDILRFDDVDVASNTNEIFYSMTQRLFLRHLHPHPCKGDEALGPDDLCGGGTVDWISWQLGQKYYFEPDFDHAITRKTPNSLLTTLDLTGVDFLSGPRHYSPIISRLRIQTSAATNAEWDLDYDTKTGRITSSNVYAGYQHGDYRFQFGDSYLNSPVGVSPGTAPPAPGTNNSYNQIHLAAVYGSETKPGLSLGVNSAYDLVHEQLQYGGLQTVYNWNCCGLGFGLRRFSLGSVRDDTEYIYFFNLAGFGSLGTAHLARIF